MMVGSNTMLFAVLDKTETWRDTSWKIRNRSHKLVHIFANRDQIRLYKAGKLYVVEFKPFNAPTLVSFDRFKGIIEAKKCFDKKVSIHV
jgi:hypothetical protein